MLSSFHIFRLIGRRQCHQLVAVSFSRKKLYAKWTVYSSRCCKVRLSYSSRLYSILSFCWACRIGNGCHPGSGAARPAWNTCRQVESKGWYPAFTFQNSSQTRNRMKTVKWLSFFKKCWERIPSHRSLKGCHGIQHVAWGSAYWLRKHAYSSGIIVSFYKYANSKYLSFQKEKLHAFFFKILPNRLRNKSLRRGTRSL